MFDSIQAIKKAVLWTPPHNTTDLKSIGHSGSQYLKYTSCDLIYFDNTNYIVFSMDFK